MSVSTPAGQIITFYSYKGGTGRSMALANVAWILAANRKKVFVIDWDLEAPGLHRYFRPFLIDKELASSNGLIDVVHSYVEQTVERLSEDSSALADTKAVAQWADGFADIAAHAISLDFNFAGEGYIDFLPAGRQVAAYPERVNTFNWHEFYQRFGGGEFLEAVKRRLRKQYDYILIDSRTGVSDTSGISTVQMPDILAVCFTYNNQSIAGAAAIAQSVREARAKGGPEAFRIFPIPTRVEQSERAKLLVRQHYARHRFASLIDHIPEHLRQRYWSEVEIPYIPFHAYEETLAALTDDPNDEKLILKAMRRITSQLTGGAVTGYQADVSGDALKAILKEFAETHQAPASAAPAEASDPLEQAESSAPRDILAQADLQMARLNADDARIAQKLWPRLVSARETSAGLVLTSWAVEQQALSSEQNRIALEFVQAGLLRRHAESGGPEFIDIANDALLKRWEPLQAWVKADRSFLEWRAHLTEARQRWENNARQSRFLLAGPVLENGSSWIKSRRADLMDADIEFFDKSKYYASRNSRVLGYGLMMLGFALVVVTGSYAYYQKESALAAEARARELAQKLERSQPELPVPYSEAPALDPAPATARPADFRPGRQADPVPLGDSGKRPVDATPSVHAATEILRRAQIAVTYFPKASDPPSTSPELTKLGYRITLGASPLLMPSNTIWFGCQAPLSSADARAIAAMLIREGVALRKLDTFSGTRRATPQVHIGAAKANMRMRALTDEEVNAFDLEAACRTGRGAAAGAGEGGA